MKQVYRLMLMEEVAKHYVLTGSNVRRVASDLGLSKSTVHKWLTCYITQKHSSYEGRKLAEEAKKLIEKNKQEMHLRGGEATRQKYISKK